MLFVLVCTEGEASEPACIDELHKVLKTQRPQSGEVFVEILTIPLGGNQGHRKIIDKAERQIAITAQDPEKLLSFAQDEDEQVKWLICDHDKMDEAGVDIKEFREHVKEAGYTLVMNKPNFEFFVVALLVGIEVAQTLKPKEYADVIEREIEALNTRNRSEKGFSENMMIPPYSKKRYVSIDFFAKLLGYHPELLHSLPEVEIDDNANFTEMPKLINALKKIYGIDSEAAA